MSFYVLGWFFWHLAVPLCILHSTSDWTAVHFYSACRGHSTGYYSKSGKADMSCVYAYIVNPIHSDSIRFTACISHLYFQYVQAKSNISFLHRNDCPKQWMWISVFICWSFFHGSFRVCVHVSLPHPESAATINTSRVDVGRLLPALTDL